MHDDEPIMNSDQSVEKGRKLSISYAVEDKLFHLGESHPSCAAYIPVATLMTAYNLGTCLLYRILARSCFECG